MTHSLFTVFTKATAFPRRTAIDVVDRPPRTIGLCFTADVFYLFNSPLDLRAPLADRRETLPHDRYLYVLYNPSPKILEALP